MQMYFFEVPEQAQQHNVRGQEVWFASKDLKLNF